MPCANPPLSEFLFSGSGTEPWSSSELWRRSGRVDACRRLAAAADGGSDQPPVRGVFGSRCLRLAQQVNDPLAGHHPPFSSPNPPRINQKRGIGTGHRAVSGASESAWSACTRRSQAARRFPEVCGVSICRGRGPARGLHQEPPPRSHLLSWMCATGLEIALRPAVSTWDQRHEHRAHVGVTVEARSLPGPAPTWARDPSCPKRPTRVRPAERLGEHVVEVRDELRRARAQILE